VLPPCRKLWRRQFISKGGEFNGCLPLARSLYSSWFLTCRHPLAVSVPTLEVQLMTRATVRLFLAAVATAGLLVWGVATAQVKQGKMRKAATKYLMRGINAVHCGGLAELLKAGPKNDEEWDTAACHASCLNEMGYLLMDDGRCPDADWANAAKTLREGSEAVLAAAQAKDLDAARAGFENVTKACGACHKAHKK
jgi:hypothetical protein